MVNRPDMDNFQKQMNSGSLPSIPLSTGRLIFLGILAMVMCNLGPFAMFAPVPLTMAFLLYGPVKAIGMSAFITAGLTFFALKVPGSGFMAAFFFLASLNAYLLSRVIHLGEGPVLGVFRSAASILILVALLLGGYELLSPVGVEQTVVNAVNESIPTFKQQYAGIMEQGGEEARLLKDFFDNPKQIVDMIFNNFVQWVVISVVLTLWASMYLLLRNGIVWKQRVFYPYTVRDMVQYRTPFWMVYPLILSLALLVGSDYVGGEKALVIGDNLMNCLGIFYFFQGFGLFLDFLSSIRIFGLFRSILIIITLLAAFKVIAIVGIFDTWLNFRRFFKNKTDEGDLK